MDSGSPSGVTVRGWAARLDRGTGEPARQGGHWEASIPEEYLLSLLFLLFPDSEAHVWHGMGNPLKGPAEN